MRWKDFMANSLPRSWTKSRRRSSVLKTNKNEQLENQENNNDLPSPVDNKFHADQNDNHFRYENKCVCVKEIPIVVPRSSIIPRRNRNLSTYNSLPKTNPFMQDTGQDIKLADDERNDETLPRTRSRIKTNPWLPSPKIPAASLTINFAASNNSLLSSPTGSRCSSMDRSLGSRSLNGSRSSSLYSRSRSLDSPKDLDLIDLVKFDDDCQSGSGKLSSGIGLASDGEGTSISSMESEGFVFYESLDDLRSSPDLKKTANRSSFNYEDHFESMVENIHGVKDSCTSLDQLQEADMALLAPPPRRNGARILVPKDTVEDIDDGIGHSDDENLHLYVNLDYQNPQPETSTKKGEKQKPKVSPKPRLSLSSTSSNDSEMVEIDLKAQSLNLNEPRASSTPKYSKRPIEEIRANLEAKVHQLRQNKFLVEEKIRAAQEEERVRERLRYHQQVTLQRKQTLVRTLSDLRTRLEGQCQRPPNACPTSVHEDHTSSSE